jgi:hypothetical protein
MQRAREKARDKERERERASFLFAFLLLLNSLQYVPTALAKNAAKGALTTTVPPVAKVNAAAKTNGEGCAANCIGNSCGEKCINDDCATGCKGELCGQDCNGEGCAANCIGNMQLAILAAKAARAMAVPPIALAFLAAKTALVQTPAPAIALETITDPFGITCYCQQNMTKLFLLPKWSTCIPKLRIRSALLQAP